MVRAKPSATHMTASQLPDECIKKKLPGTQTERKRLLKAHQSHTRLDDSMHHKPPSPIFYDWRWNNKEHGQEGANYRRYSILVFATKCRIRWNFEHVVRAEDAAG